MSTITLFWFWIFSSVNHTVLSEIFSRKYCLWQSENYYPILSAISELLKGGILGSRIPDNFHRKSGQLCRINLNRLILYQVLKIMYQIYQYWGQLPITEHIDTLWCFICALHWSLFAEFIVRTFLTQNLDPGHLHHF